LKSNSHPTTRVTTIPAMNGDAIARSPAMIISMLSAMDHPVTRRTSDENIRSISPPMTATTDTWWGKCGADMRRECGAISVRVNATRIRRLITAYGDRLLYEDLVRDSYASTTVVFRCAACPN